MFDVHAGFSITACDGGVVAVTFRAGSAFLLFLTAIITASATKIKAPTTPPTMAATGAFASSAADETSSCVTKPELPVVLLLVWVYGRVSVPLSAYVERPVDTVDILGEIVDGTADAVTDDLRCCVGRTDAREVAKGLPTGTVAISGIDLVPCCSMVVGWRTVEM